MRHFLAALTLLMLFIPYLNLNSLILYTTISGYVLLTFRFVLTERKMRNLLAENKLGFLVVILLLISYINTNNSNLSLETQVVNILIFCLCLAYFLSYILFCRRKGANPVVPLVYGFLVIVFLNLLLAFIGIDRNELLPNNESAVFLKGILGINQPRTIFFFGPRSANHMAILIAILSPLILLINNRVTKIAAFVGVAAALMMIDNRMAPLALFISVTLFYLLRKVKATRLVMLIIIVLPFLSVILVAVLPLLSDYLPQIYARNTEDLLTANSRTLIWSAVLDDIRTFNIGTIIGYGEFGNLKLSSSADYLAIFVNFQHSDVKSVHNTYLQMIMDGGLIFLAVFLLFVRRTILSLLLVKNNVAVISCIIFLIAGTTEVLIGSYCFPIIFVLLIYYFSANWNLKPLKNENQA